MRNIPVAVQMYTLREESEKDFAGTLKKVAELGFDGVEFAGYGELSARERHHRGSRSAAALYGRDEIDRRRWLERSPTSPKPAS